MMTDGPTPEREPTPLPTGKEPTPPAPLPAGRGAGGVGSLSRHLLHFLLFLLFLGLWTWKLLEPNPVPEAIAEKLKGDLKFFLGKGLHACAYAFLTLLAVTLPLPQYWRWFFVGLLVLHGVATEIGQTFVPNRTGRAYDVLIDWGGIAVGVLVWHLLARNRDSGDRSQEATDPLTPDS